METMFRKIAYIESSQPTFFWEYKAILDCGHAFYGVAFFDCPVWCCQCPSNNRIQRIGADAPTKTTPVICRQALAKARVTTAPTADAGVRSPNE